MDSKFLTNYSNITFLDKLKDCIKKCNTFCFSVSFIKKAGLTLFTREMEEALERGVKGKIITSTYQNFTDVSSLRVFKDWINKYPNFECHIDFNCFGDNGFHSKGYLFEYDNSNEFLVGSTNITRYALLKNVEWNVAIKSKSDTDSIKDAYLEFDDLWRRTFDLSEDIIKKYSLVQAYAIDKWDMDYFNPETVEVKPNSMQRKALKELRRYRDTGCHRSLVISATGSGKTYLAAFDVRNFDAKRCLFIVHRDTILKDARDTFVKVFGVTKTYGMFTGKEQDLDCDFIFASSNMLAKHLDYFKKDEFDYIVFDEVHHIVAEGGMKIFDYFNPEFLLGLTATPERMDNKDVFELFDKNVPFELRLRDAISSDLVVPFHYYAIRDEYVDYSYKDKMRISSEIAKSINVEFISSQIEKHRVKSEKLKCLAFCTNIEHCKLMAEELLDIGYNAIALTGKNDLGERIKAFRDLEDESHPLEIICAVDILNEGVDIPAVNMVLFLRPTESSTIFLQQLGRGLRKYPNKEYLTVLDFIGNNYDRSVQIALALGTLGKTTYTEKTYLMDLIRDDFKSLSIPGVEIFFDDLSKVEILDYIKNQNFNKADYLKKDYENFKKYLRKESYPTHMDYLESDIAPDLIRFLKSSFKGGKNKSYYSFLKKIGEEEIPIFNDEQKELIDNLSDLLPIVRVDEYIIIKQLLDKSLNLDELLTYNSKVSKETLTHALYILKNKKIINERYELKVSSLTEDFKDYLLDLIEYGLARYEVDFGEYEGTFKIFANYYKEQVMTVSLMNPNDTMKGTKFLDNGDTYVFVNLKKDASVADRLNYRDKFINSGIFQWESENNTTRSNSIGTKILNTKKVYLFVRKMESEDGITLPYTYFGTGEFTNVRDTVNNGKPTLTLDIILDNKVDKEYYLDFNIEEGEE